MQPVIKQLPEMIAIGKGKIVQNPQADIPPMWQAFHEYHTQIPNTVTPMQCIGLEMYEADFETTGKFFYMPALIVSSLETVPEGFDAKTLAANTYAVFTHKGSVANLHNTFMKIYREWLPASGYVMAGGYDMEWYDHRFKGMSEDNELDIYLPVKPKETGAEHP